MSQNFNQLKTYLDDKITGKKSPGVQFLIADSTGILFDYNSGFADIEKQIPVDANTEFKMYSATKLMTMIGIMQLVEQGKINLDDPAAKYTKIKYADDITVRKILNHTAGFSRNPFIKEIHLVEEDTNFNYAEFMDYALPHYNKIIYKTGKKNSYSNYGYLVLSEIVANVSGMEYEAYIDQYITAELGLIEEDNIGFKYTDQTAKGYQKRRTLTHWAYSVMVDKDKYYAHKSKDWQGYKDLYMRGLGFGGGIANARAVAALMQNLMNHGILEASTLEETFKRQIYNSNKTSKQTLGWWHAEVDSRQSFYHPGGGGGYSCEVRIYPKKGQVRVMMMNKTQTIGDLKMFAKIDKLWLNEE
ncbi:serine hydrolase domain-containing protein [Crocinitomix catalasitica]|uniref:serine hydrolase domain-containing protein n=1 Tax=Crocinitomix catalasitica TaxID=184607 RepID=UPI00146F945A|nr:serine hydrolase domain-containing protein [Crocinitomix catalasitica]